MGFSPSCRDDEIFFFILIMQKLCRDLYLFLDNGNITSAKKLVDSAIEQHPNIAIFRAFHCVILDRLGRPSEAIILARSTMKVALDENSVRVCALTLERHGEWHFLFDELLAKFGPFAAVSAC